MNWPLWQTLRFVNVIANRSLIMHAEQPDARLGGLSTNLIRIGMKTHMKRGGHRYVIVVNWQEWRLRHIGRRKLKLLQETYVKFGGLLTTCLVIKKQTNHRVSRRRSIMTCWTSKGQKSEWPWLQMRTQSIPIITYQSCIILNQWVPWMSLRSLICRQPINVAQIHYQHGC